MSIQSKINQKESLDNLKFAEIKVENIGENKYEEKC